MVASFNLFSIYMDEIKKGKVLESALKHIINCTYTGSSLEDIRLTATRTLQRIQNERD